MHVPQICQGCFWTIISSIALFHLITGCSGNESLEGRFSFSLSTFDPSGKLGQVERAIIASSLGTPIVGVIQEDRILLASPQILPSPLMADDGTTRFSNVTPTIAIAHSGISADGRVLVAAAQRLAVEHAYTYDENIPIDLFLEEMSLLYQNYTMTRGVRPFAATLLVAHMPSPPASKDEGQEESSSGNHPQLFRLDPSGSVVSFSENIAIINGQFASSRSALESSLETLSRSNNATVAEDRERLSRILQEAISPKATGSSGKKPDSSDDTVVLPSAMITASLTRQGGLEVERRKLTSSPPESTSSSSS